MDVFLKEEIIVPVLTILLSMVLYLILKRIIKRVFSIKKLDERKKNTILSIFTNLLKYLFVIFGLLVVLDAFGVDTKAIVASLGVAGVVVGLAFQDILKDTISGIFIILENQYAVGDHITVDGFRGKVISLGLKSTKIISYTGEVKTIPNRYVEQPINHSVEKPVINLEIPIPNTYDVKKTKKLLNEICEKLTNELENVRGEVKVVGIMSLTNLYSKYRIRAEIEFLTALQVRDEILSAIRIALDERKSDLMS